jgi:alginate O-acetyltransferase complex protein AlgI
MLFSSWNFIVYFLPAVVAGFYLIPSSWEFIRKFWLIAASFIFYGYWKLEYVPLLAGSILVNYSIAEGIIRCTQTRAAKHLLILGVTLNLLLLAYFKYTNFAVHFLGLVTHRDLGSFHIILPLAISFFTFTQISYIVDVYRDRHVHYRFLDYSLFVVLFPHLIAGPIVRHWEIIPQFAKADFRVNRDNFGIGATLFLFGLFKKFMADSVAVYADAVYNGAAHDLAVSSFDAWLGTVAFAFQIYFDFSSYSDMAIGLARMFGVKFPYNFDSPYKASSIIVFWERWHRTLTRFLREYVYFSLGGNRRGHLRQNINIMATMLLSGLWHGAGWTFVLWGALHGAFIVTNHLWRLWLERMRWTLEHWAWRAASVLLTFSVVSLAWTFFRAPNLHVASKMARRMLTFHHYSLPEQWIKPTSHAGHFYASLGFRFISTDALQITSYPWALGNVALLFFICWALPNTQQLLCRYDPVLEPVARPPRFQLKLGFWTGLLLGLLFYLILRNSYVTEPSPFIYFNF